MRAPDEGPPLGHFVIPDPFGPHEEARVTSSLVRTWAQGGTAAVNTPEYIRDNIHVSLLGKAYCALVRRATARVGPRSSSTPAAASGVRGSSPEGSRAK